MEFKCNRCGGDLTVQFTDLQISLVPVTKNGIINFAEENHDFEPQIIDSSIFYSLSYPCTYPIAP